MTNAPGFQSFPPPDYILTESAIEGIEVYMPRPPKEEHRPVVAFNCPQCGANTAYSAGDGGLTCTNCGYFEAPQKAVVGKGAQEFEFTVETVERAAQGWGEARKELQCQNCGAYTTVPLDMMTHTCPFCDSNKVIQHQAPQDVLRPRFLIPFKLEAAACHQIARAWMGNNWMVPANLSKVVALDRFSGMFLPFWTFDAALNAAWKAEVGHQKTERYYSGGEWKTRTYTVWRWESGRVNQVVDDLLISGTTHVSAQLLGRTNSFNLHDLAPYEPKYLAGFQAQSYDVTLDEAWEAARGQIREGARKACRKQTSTNNVRNFSMELDFADETWRYILLPFYLSTYTYQSKIYQVMINAQTGDIAGQRPVDWRKLGLVIGLIMVPALIALVTGLAQIYGLGYYRSGWIGASYLLGFIGLIIAVVLIIIAFQLDDA